MQTNAAQEVPETENYWTQKKKKKEEEAIKFQERAKCSPDRRHK